MKFFRNQDIIQHLCCSNWECRKKNVAPGVNLRQQREKLMASMPMLLSPVFPLSLFEAIYKLTLYFTLKFISLPPPEGCTSAAVGAVFKFI